MSPKYTFFSHKQSLNCRGRIIEFNKPLIIGILNITPDSFYPGSRLTDPEQIHKKATDMIAEGADILDVGACSTRPGAGDITVQEEMQRLGMALEVIRKAHPDVLISVDTFRSEIAAKTVKEYGIDMINDISGGDMDPDMFDIIASLKIPYVLMHMKGIPANMQKHASYSNVVKEIIYDFSGKIGKLNRLGVNDIIIDPGFGFAKTIEHNYQILRQLESFHIFNQPLMVGISRKSMIYRTLDRSPAEALNGTTVLQTIALMKGANLLRVHDVREAREAIDLVDKTFAQEQ
jgi:dihydropteroate synthase